MTKNTVQTVTVFKTKNIRRKLWFSLVLKLKEKINLYGKKNQNKKLENTKKIMVLTAFGLLFL